MEPRSTTIVLRRPFKQCAVLIVPFSFFLVTGAAAISMALLVGFKGVDFGVAIAAGLLGVVVGVLQLRLVLRRLVIKISLFSTDEASVRTCIGRERRVRLQQDPLDKAEAAVEAVQFVYDKSTINVIREKWKLEGALQQDFVSEWAGKYCMCDIS